MDNLSAHKGDRVKELIEERGCEVLYLPPYSPEFNPIEEAFAKIKAVIRKAEARTREALVEAIGRGITMVTTEDARGFFDHCGYTTPVQLIVTNALSTIAAHPPDSRAQRGGQSGTAASYVAR